jgi:ATP-dependent 26S proteasome regulatory subunit
VKRIQSVPLVIGQFLEAVDQNYGIVGSTMGPNYYVRILSTIDRELLKPNSSVALHKHSNALVDVLPPEADSSIAMLSAEEKPDISYADIGLCVLVSRPAHFSIMVIHMHTLSHVIHKLCRESRRSWMRLW